ncbi:DUF4258 domain-containing protein [Aeromonas salmonicida]
MYSHHAQQRMQQRGISGSVVEALLTFGCSQFHRGREVVFFDHGSLARLNSEGGLSSQTCQQLRRHYLVLQGGEVVTVGYRTCHFKRDRH